MIPNMIKRLAVRFYRTAALPLRPLASPAKFVRSILATVLVAASTRMSNPETQGDFNLPREIRIPFFITAILTSMAIAAYYGLYWVDNIAKSENTAITLIEEGAKMAPAFIAIVLLAGLSTSPLAYILIWGAGMLGAFLRRMDQSETIEELREELRNRDAERDKRLTELEEAQAQSEQDKETLRNQIRRSGQVPEA